VMAHPEIPREIVTERLVLRPPRLDDAEAAIEAIEESRAELERWMAWSPFMRTVEDARNWSRRCIDAWENPDSDDLPIAIVRREDGCFLGATGYHRAKWDIPSLDIGYWMRTSETGKGYVRETVTALTRVGFERLGLRRLVITCAATNDRSRSVAEACGYRLEGRLRNDERLPDGSLRDTLVFSLIDTDEVVRTLLGGRSDDPISEETPR
jgi:ribosomal-protein-serine acetyltransferase